MSDMTDEIPITTLTGLTDQEVEERVQQGFVNHTSNKTGKSVKEIIMSNLLTYFNLIFFHYRHIAYLCRFVPKSYVSANHYRKHNDWNCARTKSEANT